MTGTHLCTSCYLLGKENYMPPLQQFGVNKAEDVFRLYVSQGQWTMCMQSQQRSGIYPQRTPRNTNTYSNTDENKAHKQLICMVCNEKRNWKTPLTLDTHGCAACHNIFDASVWTQTLLENHKYKTRDLVCPECVIKGYLCNQYESHTCHVCKLDFGHLK